MYVKRKNKTVCNVMDHDCESIKTLNYKLKIVFCEKTTENYLKKF